MITETNGYQIAEQDGKFYVEHKYDLFTGYKWHRINLPFETNMEATEHLCKVFNCHLDEYEILKKLGRGFPDND